MSFTATGTGAAPTVGVIVEWATWPRESSIRYGTAVAVRLVKETSGSKVTVPFAFTVYVPSPATVKDVFVQLGAVSEDPHNLSVDVTSGALASPGLSFVNGEMVWFTSQSPVDVSAVAVGRGGTTGVNVSVSVWPTMSVTR